MGIRNMTCFVFKCDKKGPVAGPNEYRRIEVCQSSWKDAAQDLETKWTGKDVEDVVVRQMPLLGGVRGILEGVNVLGHLPYLQDVVFAHAGDDPVLVRAPSQVRYLGSMSTMNKKQLRGSVLSLHLGLRLANARNVPDVNAAVVAASGEDGFVEGGPL